MNTLRDPLIGRVIDSTWRIDEFVARGSMGAVYRGANTKIGTPVAIKVLNPEFLHDDEIRERFRREATVSGRCDSAHLVKVLDLCTEPDGYVALIMEWLPGETLAAYLRRHGPFSVSEVVSLLAQVGEGLAEAHGAGIIHRDLKPGNVFLTASGHGGLVIPKILDFGISKIIEEGSGLTGTATMMGTPHYMPAEQFDSSRDVDRRADIYALGVITYELLAGKRPFAGASPMQILNQITSSAPPPLPEAVPEGVGEVVLKAMSRLPEDRYDRVEDYVEAVRVAAAEAGLVPETLAPTIGLAASDGGLPAHSHPQRIPLWRRLPRWVLPTAAGGLVAVVLLVIAIARGCAGEELQGRPPAATPSDWRLVRQLGAPGVAARGFALDAGGRTLATVSDVGRVRLWRLPEGEPLGELGEGARAVTLAADGGRLAWATESGELVLYGLAPRGRVWSKPAPGVRALAFSGDGNRLLSGGSGGRAEARAVAGGRLTAHHVATGAITAVALSGDGTRAVLGLATGHAVIWDVVGRRVERRIVADRYAVASVALHAGGQRLVTGGAEGVARIWALPGGERRRELRGQGAVSAVALSEDGRWALTGGKDGAVRLWDAQTGKLKSQVRLPGPVSAVGLAEAGRLRVVSGPTLGLRVYRAPPAAR
ncbi:MAG: serine/threonine-protein kinase [bacterium]